MFVEDVVKLVENIGAVYTHDEIMKLIKEGKLVIKPFSEEIVRENGLDLRLGNEFAILDFRSEEELRIIEDLAFGKNIEKINNRYFYVWRRKNNENVRRWCCLTTPLDTIVEKQGNEIVLTGVKTPILNVHDFDPSIEYTIFKNVQYIVAPPKSSILVTTLEYVKFPEDVIGLCLSLIHI